MASDAQLTVKGDVQGDFPGTSVKKQLESTMDVWAFNHTLDSPRDEASGAPTGKRQHGPITITKAVDKASPYFVNALCANENLPTVLLQFYHPNPKTGKDTNFFVIELQNASVASIRTEQLDNEYPENLKHELREHISFTYEVITWTNNEGNTTASDDWLAPDTE